MMVCVKLKNPPWHVCSFVSVRQQALNSKCTKSKRIQEQRFFLFNKEINISTKRFFLYLWVCELFSAGSFLSLRFVFIFFKTFYCALFFLSRLIWIKNNHQDWNLLDLRQSACNKFLIKNKRTRFSGLAAQSQSSNNLQMFDFQFCALWKFSILFLWV